MQAPGLEYPYVYVDGIYLKRSWGGSHENVAVMVAIGVSEDGYREVIGCAEGFTESSECWRDFLSWLKSRGLRGVRMFVGDKAAGMVGSIAEVFPDAKYQRCTVHFYRNVLAKVPKSKRPQAAAMLKAIHAMESREAAAAKAEAVADDLESMRLKEAAKVVRDGYAETLAYCGMPREHWRRIRTNNAIERLNREIRRRTRVVGTFPDGKSALMLVAAHLKYVADNEWGPAATWTCRFSRSSRADGWLNLRKTIDGTLLKFRLHQRLTHYHNMRKRHRVREVAGAPGRGRDVRAGRDLVRIALLRPGEDPGALRRKTRHGAGGFRNARRGACRGSEEDDPREPRACGEGRGGVICRPRSRGGARARAPPLSIYRPLGLPTAAPRKDGLRQLSRH